MCHIYINFLYFTNIKLNNLKFKYRILYIISIIKIKMTDMTKPKSHSFNSKNRYSIDIQNRNHAKSLYVTLIDEDQ